MKNVTVLWTSGKSIVAIKGIHAMAFIFWVQFFRYESITEQGLSHFLYPINRGNGERKILALILYLGIGYKMLMVRALRCFKVILKLIRVQCKIVFQFIRGMYAGLKRL